MIEQFTRGRDAIVTEFAEYGSLSKIWGKNPMNYQLKVKVLDDMVVALNYLHQNSILHRDVKGENLLVFSLNPHSPVCAKLTDFGTCRNISERNLQSKALSQGIGTPTYMAPECLQNSSEYSYPVDVYAFGIVLYETYIEKNAYENDERFNQPWMIPQFVIEGNRLDKPTGIPENYWDLTTKCWKQNPEERPTFADILATIESWGEDIRYALSVEGEKKVLPGEQPGVTANTPSAPSMPSTSSSIPQEPNVEPQADKKDNSESSDSDTE
ncbi:receptor protein kinase, putative, partial [Entamoeba invadens IP1]